MKTWILLLIFANGHHVQMDMPSEKACNNAAGIVLNSIRRQSNGEPHVYWACVPIPYDRASRE